MDYKKSKASTEAITRNVQTFDSETGNIYETLAILSKRSDQIASRVKEELHQKLAEFANNSDNLDEVFENREQIEIAKFYEALPKPSLIATQELINDQIYFRDPHAEKSEK